MLLFPCIRNRVWASKVRFLIAGTEFPSSQSGRAVLFILGGETFHLFLRKKCFRRLFVLFLLTALLTWLTVPTAIVVMQLPAKEGFRLSHLEVQLKTKKGDTQLEYCIYIYIYIFIYLEPLSQQKVPSGACQNMGTARKPFAECNPTVCSAPVDGSTAGGTGVPFLLLPI